MTVVTKNLKDVAHVPDNTRFVFTTVLRLSADEESIVTPNAVRRTPENGVISVDLDPGPVEVSFYGTSHIIDVPESDDPVDLWQLISEGTVVSGSQELQSNSVALRGRTPRWVQTQEDPPLWRLRVIETGEWLTEPLDIWGLGALANRIEESLNSDVPPAVDSAIANQLPEATAEYVNSLPFSFNAAGYPTIGGTPTGGPPLSFLPGTTWNGVAGRPPTVYAEAYRDGVRTDKQIIEAAFAALQPGGELRFGNGKTYTLNAGIDIDLTSKPNVRVDAQGAEFYAPSMTGTAIRLRGTLTATTTTLTAAVPTFSRTLTVDSSAGFAVGDIIGIRSNNEVSNSETGRNYRKQELARVAAIPDGTHITLQTRTWNTYSISGNTVTISRYQPVRNLSITGLTVRGAGIGVVQNGLMVQYFDGLSIDNINVDGIGQIGVDVREGIDAKVTSSHSVGVNAVGTGYGFHAQTVHSMKFIGNYGANCRHAFDADEVRDILYLGNTAEGCLSAGLSTHGNSDVAKFIDNTVIDCAGGIVSRGRRAHIKNNHIFGSRLSAEAPESYKHSIMIGAPGNDWAGVGLVVSNNHGDMTGPDYSTDAGSPVYSYSPLVDAKIEDNFFKGFPSHGIVLAGDTNTRVRIRRNEFDASAQNSSYSTAAYVIYINPVNNTVPSNVSTDIDIDWNIISGSLHSGIRVTGGYTSSTVTEKIRIRWNRIGPCGTTPIWMANGYFGSRIEMYGNDTEDVKTATITLANFQKPPYYGPNGYGRSVQLLGPGQETGARMRPGYFYGPVGTTAVGVHAVDRLTAVPVFVSRRVTINRLAVNITTAATTPGSTGRLGLYSDVDDGYGGYPGELLAAGSVATDSTGLKVATISVTLNPGLYWAAFVPQGVQCSVTTLSSSHPSVGHQGTASTADRNCFQQTSVSGALPAPFTTSPSAGPAGAYVQIGVLSTSTL